MGPGEGWGFDHRGVAHLAHANVCELIALLRQRRFLGGERGRLAAAAHRGDLRVFLRDPELAQRIHLVRARG